MMWSGTRCSVLICGKVYLTGLDVDHRRIHQASGAVGRRLALCGVTVVVIVPGGLATALVDGQLVQGSRRRSMQRRISKLLGGALLGTVGAPVAIPAARHCR